MRLRAVAFVIAGSGLFAQTPAAPQPIPASEIAFRSEQLIASLGKISKGLVQDKTLAEMQGSVKEQSGFLQDEAAETRGLIDADPTSLDLRAQSRRWRRLSLSERASAGKLKEWANTAIAGIRTLDAEEAKWKVTLDSISRDLQNKPLQQIAVRTMDRIRALRRQAQQQVGRIVMVQQIAAEPMLLIPEVQNEIAAAEVSYRARLLHQDTEPIWRAMPDSGGEPAANAARAVGRSAQMVSEFARARGVTVLVGMTSFLLVLIYLYRVRARATAARRTSEPRDVASEDSLAIKHPLAVAFILQLPLGSALLSDAPLAVIALVILVSVVPILRILLHRAPRAARAAYLIAAFYAAGAILDLIPAGSPLRRIAFLGFLIIAIGALAAMMKSRTFRSAHVLGGTARAAKLGIAVVMLTTLAALVASLFGYLSLAQFLRQVILLSSYLALLLIAWSRVVCAVLEMILRSSVFSSPVLKTSVVVLWAGRIIRGCGFIAWVLATVNLLLLANPLTRIGEAILTKGLPGRLSDITLGDLLASVTVLAVGWLLARSARFVLREGVLSRVKLERGIPDLIANLAYYLLLLLAFLTSVKAMGVDLSKLTLLTGAFGVGIGFGMQNVLNNFFSGLILQFERPIHTGDVIEVAGQIGEVVRIGIRSTAIRTPQGAELIVPNASLVSNNVVNWSQRRTGTQISLPVLVAAGAGCENVIHLLVDAAGANAAVLRDPQPTAYLKTSGANGALFELSFSVESSASAERVRCSVAHSVSRALSLAKVVPYEMAH